MSCSKPFPPFIFDTLYYLNRNQLEHFSIVCRSLKNFIERYFHSKPYRIFDELRIRGGLYVLFHNNVQWHPNRDDYKVQQFLAAQKCSIDESKGYWYRDLNPTYYSFADMRPFLCSTIRLKQMRICVAEDSVYNSEHIKEMESIAHFWCDGNISILNEKTKANRLPAVDFLPILNSPTILQCQILEMNNTIFSLKHCKVLYSLKVIHIDYNNEKIDLNPWLQFLAQSGVKPVVVFRRLHTESVDNMLDRLSKDFSSAVLPNAFKIAFVQFHNVLSEFSRLNKVSGEELELKYGFSPKYQTECLYIYNNYTLERSSVNFI